MPAARLTDVGTEPAAGALPPGVVMLTIRPPPCDFIKGMTLLELFFQRERTTRVRVGRFGARGGRAELTEQEASEILAEMLELSGEEATLFREEQEAFLQILSAPQVVRFIVMRQQLGDRIRTLRGGGGPGRGRQGGRRPGRLPLGR